MKKKPQDTAHKYEVFDGVVLYRGEIEYVIHTLAEALEDLSISDADYTYETLEELIEHKGYRPPSFAVSASKKGKLLASSVSLSFAGSRTRLQSWFYSQPDTLWYVLRDYLSSRVPWHFRVLDPMNWFLAMMLTLLLLFVLLVSAKEPAELLRPALSFVNAFFGFLIAGIGVSFLARRFLYGVNLRRRHEAGFVKRNQDQIALVAIGSILGMVITAVFQLLISN